MKLFRAALFSLRKLCVLCASAAISTALSAQSDNSPWETVAPSGSTVYYDMKSALKDAPVCYRLDLTNADFVLDKKILPKVPKLTNLMALKLGNNHLTEIPSVFLDLPSLTYFSSANNPLTTINDSIGMLGSLRFIELYGTNFDTLPIALTGLERLQSLTIGQNKDTLFIPKEFSSLHNSLTELRIYSTILDTLTPEFTNLDKLQKIVFYKCGLTYFPYHVSKLASLKELWLDSNNITEIPRYISNLQNLQILSLSGNKIQHVPSTICFLKNLEVLDLRGNPIDPYEVACVQALLPECRILF
jgi:Leucine-rich repeat (LRR) protein